MAMGEFLAYCNLQTDSGLTIQVYELATSWCWPAFTQSTIVNSCTWLCTVDGGIINIVYSLRMYGISFLWVCMQQCFAYVIHLMYAKIF